MKGLKTTIVAAVMFALGVAMFVLWMMNKLTDDQLTKGLAGLGVLGTMVLGFLTKDADASHTFDVRSTTGGHPDPDKEEK